MATQAQIKSLQYRQRFLDNQQIFQNKFDKIFKEFGDRIARLANDPTVKHSKAFDFNIPAKKKILNITKDFKDSTQDNLIQAINSSWGLSNLKNNDIVNTYLRGLEGLEVPDRWRYNLTNEKALEAFISRTHNAKSLSDRVWDIADQARQEMEMHLSLGILNGDNAGEISRRIRQYLKNPDALFRRVRDKNGRLVESKASKAFHPGRGVYKSAYKNAMRVTRTETNMAYQLSDAIRWEQLDMVIGVRVSLSDMHPRYDYPEICEINEGIYPKGFKFIGWHPQCLCHATPVLMPREDFRAYLRGERKALGAKDIETTPAGFKNYMNNITSTINRTKSVPYWMQENKQFILDRIFDPETRRIIEQVTQRKFMPPIRKTKPRNIMAPKVSDNLAGFKEPPPIDPPKIPKLFRDTKWTSSKDIKQIKNDLKEKFNITVETPIANDQVVYIDRLNAMGAELSRIMEEHPGLKDLLLVQKKELSKTTFHIDPELAPKGYSNSSGVLAYWDPARRDIRFGQRAIASVYPRLETGYKNSYGIYKPHNVSIDFLTTFRHEYAHYLEHTIGNLNMKKMSHFSEFKEIGSLRSEFFRKNVSIYASTNYKEAWAESFAAYTSPLYNSHLPKEIEDLIKKILNE